MIEAEGPARAHFLLEQLLDKGMDIARINCAHDSSPEWAMIIDAIRHAEERLTWRKARVARMIAWREAVPQPDLTAAQVLVWFARR